MSWWDTTQFTSLASNAIKNAQKKIDKVLDIPTEDDGRSTASSSGAEKSSWSTWGSPSSTFVPSTPKTPTFDEPTSSPSLSQHTPKHDESTPSSPLVSEPKHAVVDPPIPEPASSREESSTYNSSPSTLRKEKPERRRATKQKSSEKPAAPKGLRAVKLSAVKQAPSEVTANNTVQLPATVLPATPDVSASVPDHPAVASTTAPVAQPPLSTTDIVDSALLVSNVFRDSAEPSAMLSDNDGDTPVVDVTLRDSATDPEAVQLVDKEEQAMSADIVAADTGAVDADTVADGAVDADTVADAAVDAEDKLSADDDLHNPISSSFDAADDEVVEASPAVADVSSTDPAADNNVVKESCDECDVSKDLFSKSLDSDLVLVSVDTDSMTPRGAEEERSEWDAASPQSPTARALDDSSMSDTPRQQALASISGLTSNSASSEGTVVEQVDVSPFGAAEEADADEEPDSMAAMDHSTCSDNSYVKCELPTSLNRAPSEFSLPGLTDFETATSSDIEIISMPSTYGDSNGESRMMDFVPLSRSVFKTRIRNISPNEEMSVSPLQLSPGSDKDTSSSTRSDKSSGGQREVREAENSVNSTMIKKVSQLTEVLEVRENKLLSLSQEHSELLEVNAHLKRRIEQMEETNGDLNLVKSEFGQRLHDVERKLHNALREKELVKKQYLTAQEELHNRIGTSGKMQRIVEDKDEQISALLAEGEKLAKQQLTSNNLIKKLRKKEKEQEELSRDQRDKIDSQNAELERLKAVLDSKIQNEGKHTELIKQLNSAVSNYQAELSKLKTDAEEALEKQKRVESAVDNSYKEIAELHKSLAAKDAEVRELKLGNEAHMKEELQMALDRKHKEALRDADHLTGQIEDMQLTISRMEKDQNRREECLRQEKQDLLDRLDESDKRNDELTQSVAAATKPLLRQIENLQSSYSTQSMSWERVEKNLTERLADAQNRLATATEKERQASETTQELSSQLSVLESQLSSLKQEKSKLMAEVEVSKMRIPTLQDERNNATTQLETYRANMEADIAEMRKSQTLVENKLELEKTKLDSEKKKYLVLHEQLQEKDQQIHELSMSHRSNNPSPSSAADDSRVPAMKRSMKQDELLERALSTSTMTGSSLYENMRNHSTTSLLESLESQVKQREGEIVQLQADILEHEKTRESLTKEMVKLTEENSRQESRIRDLSRLQQQYKELNGRYQALLQMYGEKEEQVTELRMDLTDIKQMYKQQIDVLMSK